MPQSFEARMRAVMVLQQHLTNEERQALATWEKVNLGDGLKGTIDWPGWADVAVRVAAQNSSNTITKFANFCYFAACFLTTFVTALVFLVGLLGALGVIEHRQEVPGIIESNLVGASQFVFVLMFGHVVGKFIARRALRRAKLPR